MSTSELIERLNLSDFREHFSENYLHRTNPGQGVLSAHRNARALTSNEISALEKNGNTCVDWSLIRVVDDFSPEFIRHNMFLGHCVLSRFDGGTVETSGGGILPRGLWYSTIHNSEIAENAVIHRCPRISAVIVRRGAIVNASSVLHHGDSDFANGSRIKVGIETGGREIAIFADLSLELAEHMLLNPVDKEAKAIFDRFLKDYLNPLNRNFTLIDEFACVQDCRLIKNSYVGPHAIISGTELIEGSTLLATPTDPSRIGSGAIIRDSIIQEGVYIDDGAIVERSMFFEHSHANQHGKVVDSLVGPNSGVSKGEATASFLGPFVGFHHQSLLIAAFWPKGRGNIGYGANVGSNHTSRVPDQEFWPGEGMFFGLGSTIKYPANFRDAPYTIIAAGVTTLPMRMSFPFSLINEPIAYYLEVPPGFNNLIPAWGLSDNLYALKRNEGKYIARNKAKRNVFDLNLFRPEILACMKAAIGYLRNIPERKTIYLPGDIPEIGKNMLTDENRLKAIDAYQFFLDLTQYRSDELRVRSLFETNRSDELSKHEIPVLSEHLRRLLTMLPSIVARTESSRSRDYERGCHIIDDYADTHDHISDDPFVRQVRSELELEIEQVNVTLSLLSKLL